MKHREGMFVGRGRVEIFQQSWLPAGAANAAVVMVHGLGEHSGRYEHVAAMLVKAGCAVYALDHRGHGRSGGSRALVDRWQNAVADMDSVVELARSQQRGKPLFLLGHSMGGTLSLAYALGHQNKLDGLMLSAPAVALDGAPPLIGPIAKLLARVAPRLGLFAIDPSIVSRDPQAAAAYEADPLTAHGKVPAGTLAEIVRLVEYLPRHLKKLKLPLLIQHGSADKLAGLSGSRKVIAKLGSADKTLLIYEGLYHEIFNELPADRARVLQDLREWLETHIPIRRQKVAKRSVTPT
ncbi:MAG: alpha/beta hydrolase [Hydrocarboniphaga sp.]|uniref:alpha/beta hydrolase n=1 Tax=Hydrocarboniphaga sp. TaxID=2033016 RepID=UPI00262C3FAF|nr:alpha/beta hydrolase [Hydrocarboniphaga sp.]MDB5971643.1 alpha/beta hydrolase [Hydrocarboniphaga sp.]